MTADKKSTINSKILIAVDIAKSKHVSIAEYPDGVRTKLTFSNCAIGFKKFMDFYLKENHDVEVALEATGDYHRAFAYFLISKGIEVKLINTVSMARMREALFNSWDKNDPKDAQVILHMLKNNHTQFYYEPSKNKISGLRELAGLHFRLTKTKTKIQHTILNHYFPLYFPEGSTYFSGSKLRWFSRFLKHFPVPASTLKHTEDEFVKLAWDYLHRIPYRERILRSFYNSCKNTIGIPVSDDSLECMSFKQALEDHSQLMDRLKSIEKSIPELLSEDKQFKILTSIPGIGPIVALNIIAESGDILRFRHSKQYLKYMGLNLCSSQSGIHQGSRKLSKRGNSRLRSILWLATKAAIYAPSETNPFRIKYSKMVRGNPENGDIKRIAISTCTAKMGRLIHTLIKKDLTYRLPCEACPSRWHEEADVKAH